MYNCNCLIHPFQNDPGTSQSQRVMEDLLAGAAKIDARTLANLLDYFMQLSRHINFYDTQLSVSDWQPFFQKSIPFTLASVIKNPTSEIEQNFALYNSLFEKKPSSTGLQLHAYFIYYRFINKINNWYEAVKGSGLPIESFLEILIKDKLQQPLKSFIGYTNAAVKWYGIKKIDFSKLDMDVWNLQANDLYAIDNSFKTGTYSKFQQINNLFQQFKTISSSFFDSIKLICAEAENNLEPSLLPLKDELQKKHPPHLGLLFAFLNIFRQLQDDLNGYTRKHLDFFYKEVLQIKTRYAIADKTHVIFEIQKQLEKYLIKKGILVKDGKDLKKQQILFSLDDDIVVNKTEVADVRTLFLNNEIIPNPAANGKNVALLEGVYMAPDATKADGIDRDFDTDVKNFYTLGNNESKYILPGTNVYKPYPNARLGFILASPVLLLNEGTRTVTITLSCSLDEKICEELSSLTYPVPKNCCDENDTTQINTPVVKYPDFLPLSEIYSNIADALKTEYYYISETLIADGIKKGLDSKTVLSLRNFLISSNENITPKTYCYCPTETKRFDTIVLSADFESKIDISSEIVSTFFKKRKPFQILFSGEKDWIDPGNGTLTSFEIVPNIFINQFSFIIKTTINPDKPSVVFYDKEKLKEDFDTNLPLVKIELDDHFKIFRDYNNQKNKCCLDKDLKFENDEIPISLYHFFRNVKIEKDSKIDVQVCGLKNFIVQNDESLQDVNGPVYPFGTRPHLSSNFYIGSKEIFYKNWGECWININWKGRPDDLEKYYQGYQNNITNIKITDFANDNFLVEKSLLNQGVWQTDLIDKLLPPPSGNPKKHNTLCVDSEKNYELHISLLRSEYLQFVKSPKDLLIEEIKDYNVNSRNGFIRLTLKNTNNVDFQHSDYSFILGRQMIAFGKLPKEIVDGAVYYDSTTGNVKVLSTDDLLNEYKKVQNISNIVNIDVNDPANSIHSNAGDLTDLGNVINSTEADKIRHILEDQNILDPNDFSLRNGSKKIKELVDAGVITLDKIAKYAAIIPNEPWTPMISNMSLDYTATATLEDIDLIHLCPYKGTYKAEEIKLQPTLFPTFCDEGTLFLGLKNLVPGNNLNLLFHLAEATSDSESEKQEVQWNYLDNNVWKPLRKGFEVLDDASENLTSSGIVKLAMPANMTNDNTIMPKGLHWIKASIPQNSKAVSETTGIYPQAISVTFTNDEANYKLRLSEALPAGSISKLNVADANVKSVQQPYGTFGGEVPEIEQQYYVRVSEQLRHKGRAIQKFDYERLALQEFPQLFKAKCINHSFALDAHLYKNDFPYAPGYVILAVIPDLNKLQAGNSFEPKVPVSIIEKIETYIRKRTSPFVRFRAMNPRYEKINFCLRVNLLPGKDENYYKEQLKEDLKELLAPWTVGKYDKLTFGQCVYRSDIIRLLENTDYVDFITDFKMSKAINTPDSSLAKICPDTPRSILIAGDIEVCINKPDCDDWKMCYENDGQIKIDCCTTEKIPVSDYCIDKTIPIG